MILLLTVGFALSPASASVEVVESTDSIEQVYVFESQVLRLSTGAAPPTGFSILKSDFKANLIQYRIWAGEIVQPRLYLLHSSLKLFE